MDPRSGNTFDAKLKKEAWPMVGGDRDDSISRKCGGFLVIMLFSFAGCS